jgi:hypothetical protein
MKKETRTTITCKTTSIIFLSLVMLFASITLVETKTTQQLVYAQNATSSNQTSTSSNATTTTTAAGVTDFKTLRDQYVPQWQQLNFQLGFDTFVESGSVRGYGVYQEHPSNIFNPDTSSIVLYLEPVGYGYKEGVDKEGTVLYSFDFNATINISDKQGNPVTKPIPADFGEALNSHNKATEAFMPITITLEDPLPIGEYRITYTLTDGTSGKSFETVKDIKVAETVS